MEIKSLGKTSYETIEKAFGSAFADYEMRINASELKAMLKRRGFCPDLSFAAFEDEAIVAFTLNGIGNFNGRKTAYDTGTGTLKEYRGKGLATRIFEYSLPYLREANIKQYLLEVLQHNAIAISVYRKMGFEATREFNYFLWKNGDLNNEIKEVKIPCRIERIDKIDRIDIEDIEERQYISGFWDFYPSWQNSFESIRRSRESFISLGAFSERKLAGCCIFEYNSGDITQIAVDKPFRRKGIASLLLHEASKLIRSEETGLINADASCSSIVGFLKSKNIELSGKQYEMMKEI